MEHQITRHRHELKRRTLTVRETADVTPGMLRIVLEGADLADFPSLSPDDHVKLFIPTTTDRALASFEPITPRRCTSSEDKHRLQLRVFCNLLCS